MPLPTGQTAWESTQAGDIAKRPCWMKRRASSLDYHDACSNDKSSKLNRWNSALREMSSKYNMSIQDCVDGGETIPVSVTNDERGGGHSRRRIVPCALQQLDFF